MLCSPDVAGKEAGHSGAIIFAGQESRVQTSLTEESWVYSDKGEKVDYPPPQP